jgi:hypothetical protein
VVVAHRRCGKTIASLQKLIVSAISDTKSRPRYAFIAPLFRQAKTVAWDALRAMTAPYKPKVNEAELRVDFDGGARIQLFGADSSPDSLRGQYLDGCVMDEFAQMDPRVWTEVVRPALSDRHGWCVWIGTPAGPNAFRDLYEDAANLDGWSRYMFKASETGILEEEELAAARREMPPEAYAQEYLCDFSAAIRGAYYGSQMSQALEDGRITSVPHDSQWPVETWWDLGMRDQTVIWFAQRIGAQVRLIDLYANTGSPIDHYAQVLDSKPYTYSRHIAPHDIEVRELGTGKSRRQIAQELGLEFEIAPNLKVQDGINAARMLLPRCWFDSDKCRVGTEALQLYRAKYMEKERVFQATPLHDWTSHYADAFRMGAVIDADPEWDDIGNVAVPSAHRRAKRPSRVAWHEPIPYG